MSRKTVSSVMLILLVASALTLPLIAQTVFSTEIGGLHYVYWNFPVSRFNSLCIDIGIISEPTSGDGIYFQMYQGSINGVGFYFGLQTQVYNPNTGGSAGKGLIFSRWGTRDLSNARVVEGGWSQSAGYEGDFIGVRKHYDWTTHEYRLRLALNDTDDVGDWYGVWITDLNLGTVDILGALRFPKVSAQESGIENGGITWTELYSKAIAGTPIPTWHVTIIDTRANDGETGAVSAMSTYSDWTNNTDIFCDDSRTIHLLMGENVTRTHSPGVLFSGNPYLSIPVLSNIQRSPPESTIQINQPIAISVDSTDPESAIKRVILSYRVSTDNVTWSYWTDSLMAGNDSHSWTGTIRGFGSAATIQYEITAYDDANNPSAKTGGELGVETFAIHEIGIIRLESSKTVVGQGYNVSLDVTVHNYGSFTETFNLTVYANGTEIQKTLVTITDEATMKFVWNTTDYAEGNYTTSVYVPPILGETNTANNNCTGGCVTITIPGDVDGDFAVKLTDLVALAKAYSSKPTDSNWNPNADIDDNGTVGLSDLVALAQHYGQHYP